jgi:nucleoside-diphosphate-sugar epimerase
VHEAVDARIVARAVEWAFYEPAASGETFNVTNGDVYAWREVWPAMMEVIGVEAGPDLPRSLAKFLPEHSEDWRAIAKKCGLAFGSLDELIGLSHFSADWRFAYDRTKQPTPRFLSTVKIRRAGFADVMDTEESLMYWLKYLMSRRVLPAADWNGSV